MVIETPLVEIVLDWDSSLLCLRSTHHNSNSNRVRARRPFVVGRGGAELEMCGCRVGAGGAWRIRRKLPYTAMVRTRILSETCGRARAALQEAVCSLDNWWCSRLIRATLSETGNREREPGTHGTKPSHLASFPIELTGIQHKPEKSFINN